MLSVQRLQQLVDVKPERGSLTDKKKNPVQPISSAPLTGRVEFKDVEMRYKHDLEPALKNLSFSVQAGEQVAVVGRTGAGKSSLFQLLFRFRSASKGQVLIDGKSVEDLDLQQLRKSLNVVLQQSFVISNETLRQNLDPVGLIKDDVLLEALRESSLIQTKEDAANLTLDTLAKQLSTGQTQLLALTQALITAKTSESARLLLLDEPTSQIDEGSQRQVLDALLAANKAKNGSSIMIAHKLESAVRYSDRIIVMD